MKTFKAGIKPRFFHLIVHKGIETPVNDAIIVEDESDVGQNRYADIAGRLNIALKDNLALEK